MKRRFGITILLTMILSFAMTTVNAQDHTVPVGSTFKYKVDDHSGNGYAWVVRRTAGDASGTMPSLSNQATREVTIIWESEGTYEIELTETKGTCTTVKTYIVLVEGNTSTVTFVALTEKCADDIPAVNTNFTSDVTFAAGTAPWTIVYSVGTGADQTVELTDAGGTSITFSKDFINAPGGSDQEQVITIKDAYDKYKMKPGNRLDITTNNITITYRMHEVPNTSTITHN